MCWMVCCVFVLVCVLKLLVSMVMCSGMFGLCIGFECGVWVLYSVLYSIVRLLILFVNLLMVLSDVVYGR